MTANISQARHRAAQGAFSRTPGIIVLVVSLTLAPAVTAHQNEAHEDSPLGRVDFPVSCSSDAQAEFNHAVALLHHMTYPLAREAFRQVASIDPHCAMAQWGIAITLFQPLWPTRPGPEALQRGWAAVQKAESLGPPTEREQLFVEAAKAFFLDPESPDYWLRIRRWEEAMEKAFAAYPDDPEVTAFFALALLATAPTNTVSRANADRAADLLLGVFEQNPDHPGAMHYMVHANDMPGRERDSLDITRKYESVAPRNPHALHMPTHIYTRLGDWDGVIRGNLLAAQAALESPAGDNGEYVWDEFPHAIEYLIYAYLQEGADDEAGMQLQRLLGTNDLQPSFKTAFHLASTQARFALERQAWDEAAQLTPREPDFLDWDRFTWPESITWFARGLGAAHLGQFDAAITAAETLEALEEKTRAAGEDLFARNIRVLQLELSAWTAHAQGHAEKARDLMREAAALEASTPKHPVTPGPTLPAEELLGDLLVEQGRPAEALAAYERSAGIYPWRFNSLLGAADAARMSGDEALSSSYCEKLRQVAQGGTRLATVDSACLYSPN